jgi:hypothetical protein
MTIVNWASSRKRRMNGCWHTGESEGSETIAGPEFCRFRDTCYINATLGKFSHSVTLRNRLHTPMLSSAGFGVSS